MLIKKTIRQLCRTSSYNNSLCITHCWVVVCVFSNPVFKRNVIKEIVIYNGVDMIEGYKQSSIVPYNESFICLRDIPVNCPTGIYTYTWDYICDES